MARVTRPGGRVVVLEITTPQQPPLSWFFRFWFDQAVPRLGRFAGDPDAYTYLPSSVDASPAPSGWRRMAARGLTDVRWVLTAGGIIALHGGTVGAAAAQAQLGAAVIAAGGRGWERLLERTEERLARSPRARAGAGAPCGGHARRGRQAPSPDAGVLCAGTTPTTASWPPPWPWSCCTWRRSSTTTCWTGRRCGAGAPRCSRGRAAAATASGDLLFSRAFAELAGTGSEEAVTRLSGASSALARGELMQRADAWMATWPRTATSSAAGSRPRASSTPAAGSGRCSAGRPEHADALGDFGGGIGLAFQLLDDVLDVSGPAERTGKPRGTDLLDGTVTLPLILARRRDPELRRLDLRAAATDAERAEALCERIAATGALEEARALALQHVSAAKGRLEGLGLPTIASRRCGSWPTAVERYA